MRREMKRPLGVQTPKPTCWLIEPTVVERVSTRCAPARAASTARKLRSERVREKRCLHLAGVSVQGKAGNQEDGGKTTRRDD